MRVKKDRPESSSERLFNLLVNRLSSVGHGHDLLVFPIGDDVTTELGDIIEPVVHLHELTALLPGVALEWRSVNEDSVRLRPPVAPEVDEVPLRAAETEALAELVVVDALLLVLADLHQVVQTLLVANLCAELRRMVSKGRIDGVLVLLESVLVVVSVNSELELVLDRLAALADNILKTA